MLRIRHTGCLAAAALVAASAPATAGADERIVAGGGNRYLTPTVTIDQGERLTFVNQDVSSHDVTASQNGADGVPLFQSDLIGPNREVPVRRAEHLTTGSYGFFCSVHPFMTGTLNVSSAGTPVPRPAPDTAAPALGVALRTGRLPARRLVARVSVDEAAEVALVARTRVRGRTITIARGTVAFSAGATRDVAISLTRAGRRALARGRRLSVSIRAAARDSAGNSTIATARRTLRR